MVFPLEFSEASYVRFVGAPNQRYLYQVLVFSGSAPATVKPCTTLPVAALTPLWNEAFVKLQAGSYYVVASFGSDNQDVRSNNVTQITRSQFIFSRRADQSATRHL